VVRHYYNEIEPYAVQWLRNLMDAGHIPPGDIDTRSIEDVRPSDLAGYVQCHFFAGIGGWPLALALAGWPSSRPVWTGSCPCQPFSVAGKGDGASDKRHLWPAWFHLISQQRPAVVFGEQVAAAVGHQWLDGVCADLEGQGYAIGASVLPACAVGAPHRRDRLWFVADTGMQRCEWREDAASRNNDERSQAGRRKSSGGLELCGEVAVADASGTGLAQRERERGILRSVDRESQREDVAHDYRFGDVANANQPGASEERTERSGQLSGLSGDTWSRDSWISGHDGKARRIEPSVRLLAHGIPARVGKLRALGNAIVPQVAAEFIQAYAEARGLIPCDLAMTGSS
jgi:DNA (cytosine-5)-methyltransferase 1